MNVPNPPKGLHWITPHLYYRDVSAALQWLERVFGFVVREKAVDDFGVIDFAEMDYRGDIIILSRGPDFPGACSPAESKCYSQHIHIYVDDIQKHYEHCLQAGARCLTAPAYIYWGDMIFRAEDYEGHLWTFAQHVKDVAEAELKPE